MVHRDPKKVAQLLFDYIAGRQTKNGVQYITKVLDLTVPQNIIPGAQYHKNTSAEDLSKVGSTSARFQ